MAGKLILTVLIVSVASTWASPLHSNLGFNLGDLDLETTLRDDINDPSSTQSPTFIAGNGNFDPNFASDRVNLPDNNPFAGTFNPLRNNQGRINNNFNLQLLIGQLNPKLKHSLIIPYDRTPVLYKGYFDVNGNWIPNNEFVVLTTPLITTNTTTPEDSLKVPVTPTFQELLKDLDAVECVDEENSVESNTGTTSEMVPANPPILKLLKNNIFAGNPLPVINLGTYPRQNFGQQYRPQQHPYRYNAHYPGYYPMLNKPQLHYGKNSVFSKF